MRRQNLKFEILGKFGTVLGTAWGYDSTKPSATRQRLNGLLTNTQYTFEMMENSLLEEHNYLRVYDNSALYYIDKVSDPVTLRTCKAHTTEIEGMPSTLTVRGVAKSVRAWVFDKAENVGEIKVDWRHLVEVAWVEVGVTEPSEGDTIQTNGITYNVLGIQPGSSNGITVQLICR